MAIRRVPAVVLAFLALSALCSCKKQEAPAPAAATNPVAPAPAPAAPTKVKLALNWVPEPEFGGFYAAREGGAFAKEKLDVEILGGGAGAPVVQMVAQGQVDFGI